MLLIPLGLKKKKALETKETSFLGLSTAIFLAILRTSPVYCFVFLFSLLLVSFQHLRGGGVLGIWNEHRIGIKDGFFCMSSVCVARMHSQLRAAFFSPLSCLPRFYFHPRKKHRDVVSPRN
jgi:hypothetical protein